MMMKISHILTVIALLSLLATHATAQSLEMEINQIGETAAQLKSQDVYQSAIAEIQKAELWIGQAQAFMAAEKEEEARAYLTRVQFMNQLVQLILEEAQVRKTLQETLDQSAQAEQDANQAKELLRATHERLLQLESMGL